MGEKYNQDNLLHHSQDIHFNFTDNGGTIEISATIRDEFIKISVSDTGIGIDEEDIEKLFKINESCTRDWRRRRQRIRCRELVEKNRG
ncbi:ATP-binding protein [Desulfococcaceae bacterium HSG8]|nr:ATP-binding protein [Desulfococcaceae bacterium HSG8]